MVDQSIIDCALMSGVAYESTRPDKNKFPIPNGWEKTTLWHRENPASGFEAVSFIKGNEIVISFAGTDIKDINDLLTDGALGAGNCCQQLLDAAKYYLDIKSQNPDAKITFTGHSLGGGLAALLGVFFNVQAITFDEAPFRNSINISNADSLLQDLTAAFPVGTYPKISEWLAPLNQLIDSVLDPVLLAARESKVTGIVVQGEKLEADWPYDWFSRIGYQDELPHGPTNISSGDLHSQALLTAFMLDGRFRLVTYKLTNLLNMIFDSNLYYHDPTDKENPQENFLERLIYRRKGVKSLLGSC
jgi:hypothetical protein